MNLTIQQREQKGIVILDLNGRLTLGEEANRFRELAHGLLGEGKKAILLNMTDVTHVDSSGIGALVEAVVLAANQSGRVKLFGMQRRVHNALVVHRLVQAFQIFEHEAEGLASFSEAASQNVTA